MPQVFTLIMNTQNVHTQPYPPLGGMSSTVLMLVAFSRLSLLSAWPGGCSSKSSLTVRCSVLGFIFNFSLMS